MLNKFKSIFTPKKTKKQNLKYSPYEKKSPRNINKEINEENKNVEVVEIENENQTSKSNNLIFEQKENSFQKENEKENKIIKNIGGNENKIQNLNIVKEAEAKPIKENEKKDEKKKLDVEDENKNKRIKLNTFQYFGTGYSRNSHPYMPSRKLQTKKSSVLFYKKKLNNISKEKIDNVKTSIPEISHTAKLILDVVEKEENKYKKPMKMKKLEKKIKSNESNKKLNNDNEINIQNNKKIDSKTVKRITPENISSPKSDLQVNSIIIFNYFIQFKFLYILSTKINYFKISLILSKNHRHMPLIQIL